MSIKASYILHADGDEDPDSGDRLQITPAADGFVIDAYGRSYQGNDEDECLSFMFTRENLVELVTVCNALLNGDVPSAQGSGA